MPKLSCNTVLLLILMILSVSCTQIPSTKDIDNDIADIDKAIIEAEHESHKYSGGLIKTLIEVRHEVLTTTKAILEQKRSGLRRFVPIRYTVDGNGYQVPQNKNELLKAIEQDLAETENEIVKARHEQDQYSGGLIKSMILARLATLCNTSAFLKQKELLLKYDIPLYSVLHKVSDAQTKTEFKSTPGKDTDKF